VTTKRIAELRSDAPARPWGDFHLKKVNFIRYSMKERVLDVSEAKRLTVVFYLSRAGAEPVRDWLKGLPRGIGRFLAVTFAWWK
jgi:hypothetical protein